MFEKFEIRKGNVLDKIKRFFRNITEKPKKFFTTIGFEKKILMIILPIIALAVVGSITGYTSMVLTQHEKAISTLRTQLRFCESKLEDCNATRTQLSQDLTECQSTSASLTSELDECKSERENCETSLTSCIEEKNKISENLTTCQSNLDICSSEREEYKTKYEETYSAYTTLGENYAQSKCCPPEYEKCKYYTITSNNDVLCCCFEDETYFCGLLREETSADKVRPLTC
jgi:flagellar biosynthesis chaperone FliJ